MNDFEIATQGPQYAGASPLLGRLHTDVDIRLDGRELTGSPLAFWMPDMQLMNDVRVTDSPELANEPLKLGNMEVLIP